MNIGSICQRELITIDVNANPMQAAQLMRAHHVGALLVTGPTPQGPALVGLVTDRDLVLEVLALRRPVDTVTMQQLARSQAVCVSEDDDLMTAVDEMRHSGVRRLLVVNRAQQVVGIVALEELMEACAREISGLAGALQAGLAREVAAVTPEPAPVPPAPPLHFPAVGTAGWTL